MASTILSNRLIPGNFACTWPRAATILGAVIATLAIWCVATFAGNIDLHANGMDIGPVAVALGTLVPGLVAWGLLTFLERRTASAWPIWRTIAFIVLAISLLGALGADTGTGKIVLGIMHGFAGAIIIKGFSNTVRA